MAIQQLRSIALPGLAVTAGATAPNPGLPGVWAWSTTLGVPVQWNGTSWRQYSPVSAGAVAPSNPSVGDVWIDTNTAGSGAGGSLPIATAFAQAIPFDAYRNMGQVVVSGALTFTVNPAASAVGGETTMSLVANGVNAPNLSAFALASTASWDNTLNKINELTFFRTSAGYYYGVFPGGTYVPPGSLTYTTPAYVAENLTTRAGLDYVMVGLTAGALPADDNRKAGAGLLGPIVVTNTVRGLADASPVSFTSTDGTVFSGSRPECGQFPATLPASVCSVSITAPAGTAARFVDVWAGTYTDGAAAGSHHNLKAALSDASAAPLTIAVPNAGAFSKTFTHYRFAFNAASAAQTLTITLETPAGKPAGYRMYLHAVETSV